MNGQLLSCKNGISCLLVFHIIKGEQFHFSSEWPSMHPGVPCPGPSTTYAVWGKKKQNTKTTSCFSSTMLSIKACICWLCYFVYQNGDTAVATALALISLNLLLHWMQINIATNGFQAVSLLQLPPLHSCAALFFGTSSYYWGGFNWSPSFLHASVIKTALREHSQFQNCNINKLEHPWIRQHVTCPSWYAPEEVRASDSILHPKLTTSPIWSMPSSMMWWLVCQRTNSSH